MRIRSFCYEIYGQKRGESIECFIHFQSEWSLFLPSDRWVYLWDEKEEIVAGPKLVTVIAPMGKNPSLLPG